MQIAEGKVGEEVGEEGFAWVLSVKMGKI